MYHIFTFQCFIFAYKFKTYTSTHLRSTRPKYNMLLFIFLLVLDFSRDCVAVQEETIPCDSLIYCDGPLLRAIQTSEIFEESKVFVDMKINSKVTIYKPIMRNMYHYLVILFE